MVYYKKSQRESLPDLGPNIEVIRRIPDDEFKRMQRESLPDLGPNIEVIRRIPKHEYETISPEPPEITQREAFWNSLKHALSLNLDDEFAAITAAGRTSDDQWAIKAFFDGFTKYWGGDKQTIEKYDKEVEKIRDYYRRASDAHYWTSLGGNVLGTILPSLLTLGGGVVASGARFLAPQLVKSLAGSSLGKVLLKAGSVGKVANPYLGITNKTTLPHLLKVGALSGGLHGFGEGEGLGNTVSRTLAGAGLGAAGTVVGSGLGHVASSIVGGIGRLFTTSYKQGVEKATLRAISKHLGNEESEDLGKTFGSKAVDTDYIVDHSPFLQNLVFDIARKNQGAYLYLTQKAKKRALQGGERIHKAVDKQFVPRQNLTSLQDDLIANREKASHDLYEIAKKIPIGKHHYGALNELMERPYFREAYNKGLKGFISDGNKTSPFSSQKFSLLEEKPNMGVLHKTKEAIDAMIKKEKKQGDNSKVRSLVDIKKKLLEIMDAISPEYKKARGLFYQYSSYVDAMRDGSKILRKKINNNKFSKIFDELSEAEQEYFKKGSRGKLLESMGQTGDKVSKAKEIFDMDDLYDRFAKIYGSDQASAVKNVIEREANYADFYNRIPNRIANKDISFTHDISIPTSKNDAAMQLGKAALKASWIPFKEAAARERQRIEKDVVKLLTGGTKISNKKIVELIQSMVRAKEKGYATKEWVKKLSAALFGGGGKSSIEDLNVLSAF